MRAQIIQAVPRFGVVEGGRTDTAGNYRKRLDRRAEWRKANATTEFYHRLWALGWVVDRAIEEG
jgi:hypothetical protein